MSASAPSNAPPQKPTGTLFVIALGTLMTFVLVCGGLCAGLLYYGANRAETLSERAEQALDRLQRGQPPLASPPVADWMTSRVLAPVYTVALDAVASNEQVIERLGDPIEPALEADELYRRTSSGELAGDETIEFDILGAKGTAVVSVVASNEAAGSPPGMAYSAYRAATITVTFSDGAKIEVPPPKDQPGMEIR
jgi:hypothetical protein